MLTFSRPAQNLTASAARRIDRRKEQSRPETDQAVEMTRRWKARKTNNRFPPFPLLLEIASRFPHSHRFDDDYIYKVEAKATSLKESIT